MANYTGLLRPVPLTLEGSISLAASLAAGSITYVVITPDPTQPSVTTNGFHAPSSETWVVTGVETYSAPAVDGVVRFKINTVDQNVTFGPLSQTLPTIFHRKALQNFLELEANADTQPYFVNYTAGGTASTAIDVQMFITRLPRGYKGAFTVYS